LIPRRDIYGRPLERPGYFITRFLSPVQISKERRNLVDEEMKKLEIAVGYPSKIAFGESLTNYEFDAYVQDSGARIYEQLYLTMRTAEYQARPVYEKERIIKRIVRECRERSKLSLFVNKKQIANFKKGLIAQGYTEAQVEEEIEMRFGKPIEVPTMAEMLRIYQPRISVPPVRPPVVPTMGEMFKIAPPVKAVSPVEEEPAEEEPIY